MHHKITARFWEGLETGEFKPWTTPEISALVEEMLGSSPLRELTTRDREVISIEMHFLLSSNLNRNVHHQLASDPVYFFPTAKEIPPGTDIFVSFPDKALFFVPPASNCYERNKKEFDTITAILAKAGKEPLSRLEKKNILSDPTIWLNARLNTVGIDNLLVGYGMRPLTSYGINAEQFMDTVKRVQNATGKDKINLLDVGGANGLALQNARKLTDIVITHNLTPTMEPAMFSTDFLYVCPAERMPESFREQMDLILSNYAFCYFPGQDLALENILQALSVGGEANIEVSFGKQGVLVDNFVPRMAEQYKRMKHLHDLGYITIKVDSDYNPHPLDFPVSQNNFYPPAQLYIRKNKSLTE